MIVKVCLVALLLFCVGCMSTNQTVVDITMPEAKRVQAVVVNPNAECGTEEGIARLDKRVTERVYINESNGKTCK